jgi:hypothetical protein
MTDIIKDVEILDSRALLEHLKATPALIRHNVETFRQEVHDLNSGQPTILAFGHAAHGLLAKHIPASEYARLIKVTHYSDRISKENYRQKVLAQVDKMADAG